MPTCYMLGNSSKGSPTHQVNDICSHPTNNVSTLVQILGEVR